MNVHIEANVFHNIPTEFQPISFLYKSHSGLNGVDSSITQEVAITNGHILLTK